MQIETDRHRASTRRKNRESGIPDMDLGDRHEPIEYFAQVGFHWLLDRIGGPSEPAQDWSEEGGDERDHDRFIEARRQDHQRIADWLRDAKITPKPNDKAGCSIGDVYLNWPDRVPALKVWTGQMTLAKIAKKLQACIPAKVHDVLALISPLKGSSGLDRRAAPTALELGFSLNETGMAVETHVGIELLGIIGLETLPLTVYPDGRRIGYEADELRGVDKSRWMFAVEDRGDYYGRWGTAERQR